MAGRLKIAVASSGLGHIRRGVETWPEELGIALHCAGHNVHVFQGAGRVDEEWRTQLPCLRRFAPETRRVVNVLKHFGGWHYGFGSGYDSEQTTFTISLWTRVHRDFDILHVKDPRIALWMDRSIAWAFPTASDHFSRHRRRDLYVAALFVPAAHGSAHLEAYRPYSPPRQLKFHDSQFREYVEVQPGDRIAARRQWGLPDDGLVFLCVSAIPKISQAHRLLDRRIHGFSAQHQAVQPPL